MDFEAAHKILDKMVAEKTSIYDDDKDVIEATDYIFNAESLYLVSQNTSEANTRVIYLFSELPIKGVADPEGTEISESGWGSDDKGYMLYKSYANRFNAKCLSILNTAISVGNKEVAERIISMIKDDASTITKKRSEGVLHYGDGTSSSSDEYYVYVHYTTESKDKAKKLYEEAVKEGKFK